MTGSVTDEIKAKLDIVQVISEYLPLKKAGTRMVGLCPFHHEKTPSFSVSPDMGFWYCFGCSKGGDVISFVQELEGMEFPDALRVLAKKAGVELRFEDSGIRDERQRLLDANGLAGRFFHEVLLRSGQAAHARAYVEKRGLKPETVEDFMIGYAPDSWDATLEFLRKKGVKDADILSAGLASKNDRGGLYDRFRGRLTFPIRDVHGNVVGFTARIMPTDGEPPKEQAKYINTTQTAVYDKSAVLFGLDRARQEIRQQKAAVVVEGNMDVIASHQAGVRNVVASSGTALTDRQVTMIKRYANRLVLSFDKDKAGERAAVRGIDLAVAAGCTVRILRLPDGSGKDPDDCIRKDPSLWKQAIEDAIPYMEWYMSLVRERIDLSDPDAKKEASVRLLREIAKMPEPVERAHWIKEVSSMFETPESLLFEKVESMRVSGPARTPAVRTEKTEAIPSDIPDRDDVVSEMLVGVALAWRGLADMVISQVPESHVTDGFRELYSEFKRLYTENHQEGSDLAQGILHHFAQGGNHDSAKAIARARLMAEKEFGELSEDERKEAVSRLIGELKTLHLSRRTRELTQAMAHAEKAGDVERIRTIENELNGLM